MTLPPLHDEALIAEALEDVEGRLAEIYSLVFEANMKTMSPLYRMTGRERLAFYDQWGEPFVYDALGQVVTGPDGQPVLAHPYWKVSAMLDGQDFLRELRDYRDLQREHAQRNGAV